VQLLQDGRAHVLPQSVARLATTSYTTAAILSFFFVLRFVSETKGKELEEMRL
jgi:hypothetical protein